MTMNPDSDNHAAVLSFVHERAKRWRRFLISLLFVFIAAFIFYLTATDWTIVLPVIAWITSCILYLHYMLTPCPSCRKPFAMTIFYGDPFARKCCRCGESGKPQ
jgi:hypothetical protein